MSIPKRGEIWAVDLNPTAGHEQQNKRPCLVLSETAFNQIGIFVVAPITGGSPGPYAGFSTKIEPEMGMKTYGTVLAHQVRSLDYKARGASFVEKADPTLLEDVLAKHQVILGTSP